MPPVRIYNVKENIHIYIYIVCWGYIGDYVYIVEIFLLYF